MAAPTMRSLLHRVIRDPHGDGPLDGTRANVSATISRTVLAGNVAWQLIMLTSLALSPGVWPHQVALAVGNLLAIVAMVLVWQNRAPAWLPVGSVYLLFLWVWSVTDSADSLLLFAACWMVNLTSVTATFTMRGPSALLLPIGAGIALSPAMLLTRPGLDSVLLTGVPVTTIAIVVATRFGYSFIIDVAARADDASQEALLSQEADVAARTASVTAAEHARVLHDTVINTLAAIASGSAALGSPSVVQQRCATDAATAEAVRTGVQPAHTDNFDFRTAGSRIGFPVHRDGVAGDELAELQAQLPVRVGHAMSAAVEELVQNAAQHSEADNAELLVRLDDNVLTLRVADDGVGFDGSYPTDRGLARSVVQRATEAGIEVDVESAPGRGTAVTLRWPLANPAPEEQQQPHGTDLRDAVLTLRKQAAFAWATGVATVGFVLAAANHPGELTSEYGMAAVGAAGAGFAWYRTRRRSGLGATELTVLAACAVTAFVLSAMAVDYGRDNPAAWQAIGATGLLVLTVEHATRRWLWATLTAYGLTVATIAAAIMSTSPTAAAIVVVAGLAGLGLTTGWAVFHQTLTGTANQVQSDQQAAAHARLTAARRRATGDARTRWQAAGLDQTIALLSAIALGTVDHASSATRSAAAAEEAFMRQLILLSPDLIHLAPWLARALHIARRRRVDLRIRAGGADPEVAVAERWGATLLELVGTLPEGDPLTVTVFPTAAGIQATIVGQHPQLGDLVRSLPTGRDTRGTTIHTYGPTDVVEFRATPDAH